jgi:uncharacterized protein (DUF3820 family)
MNIFPQNEAWFKPEIRSFSFGPTDPPPVFTEQERKLVILGLNSAAFPGEVDNCAIALFRSWRARGIDAERVIMGMVQATRTARDLAAARGYIVPFGKFKGKSVAEIPSWYLHWLLYGCDTASPNLKRAVRLVLENLK